MERERLLKFLSGRLRWRRTRRAAEAHVQADKNLSNLSHSTGDARPWKDIYTISVTVEQVEVNYVSYQYSSKVRVRAHV